MLWPVLVLAVFRAAASHGDEPARAAAVEPASSTSAGETASGDLTAALAEPIGCALETLPPETALGVDCVSCHATRHDGSRSHPAGVDYAAAAAAGAAALRPLAQVIARGVRLPDGRIACVTCHDPWSPWGDHLAIPEGGTVTPAVHAGLKETYEEGAARPPPAPGSAVSPKPLCLACHAFD